MRRKLLAAAVVLAGVGAVTALAVNQMGPSVAVSLKEFKVLSPSTTKAGKVTFVVKNKGKLKHEFIVVKTNLAAGKLPLKGTKVNLSGLNVRGKIAAFKPGTTKRLTVKLAPGKYVLFCNVPSHYQAGQHKAFKVS